MCPMSTDSRHGEAMRNTLARHAARAPDAGAVAEVVLATWSSMVERLSPVIGVKGVDVLFRRALQLTGKTFPWLAIAEEYGNSASLLKGLKARFELQDASVATEAGNALLGIFTDLLTSLLGAPLTERLLGPVWQSLPPESDQETSP